MVMIPKLLSIDIAYYHIAMIACTHCAVVIHNASFIHECRKLFDSYVVISCLYQVQYFTEICFATLLIDNLHVCCVRAISLSHLAHYFSLNKFLHAKCHVLFAFQGKKLCYISETAFGLV